MAVKNHQHGSLNPKAQFGRLVELAEVMGSTMVSLANRQDPAFLDSVQLSAERAYEMAGVGPGDIQLAEVHDCFCIAEICCIEALGLVEKGQGGQATASGFTALGGKVPVNTSGGLKSKGHPVGATGIAQAIEVFEQLQGRAGDRQVEGARVGLSQNMGGSGASSAVHIFERA